VFVNISLVSVDIIQGEYSRKTLYTLRRLTAYFIPWWTLPYCHFLPQKQKCIQFRTTTATTTTTTTRYYHY